MDQPVAQSPLPADAVRRLRPRVGIVVPASNTTCEIELNRLGAGLFSVHTSRMNVIAGATGDPDQRYAAALAQPLRELALCHVDVAALGCTTAAMACRQDTLRGLFAAWPSSAVALVSDAVVAALRHVGVHRVALYSPYTEQSNASISAFLAQAGVVTVGAHGLGLNTSPEAFSAVSMLTPDFLVDGVSRMDRGDADGIFLSCTDMPTLDVIEPLEAKFGVPVISTNLALFWYVAKALGLDPATAPGRLMHRGSVS